MEVPHTLGRDKATERLKKHIAAAVENYKAQLSDLREEWQDQTLSFGFKAVGMKVAGSMTVEDSRVRVEADLPLAAMMIKGMIEQQVRDGLSQVLSPSA